MVALLAMVLGFALAALLWRDVVAPAAVLFGLAMVYVAAPDPADAVLGFVWSVVSWVWRNALDIAEVGFVVVVTAVGVALLALVVGAVVTVVGAVVTVARGAREAWVGRGRGAAR